MLEEGFSSMSSWFTPTVLFILLNLVIGTIAVISGFGNKNQNHHQQQQQQQQQVHREDHHHHHHHDQYDHRHQIHLPQQPARAPSNVIQRLKSINLYGFKAEDLNPFHSTYDPPPPPPPEIQSGDEYHDHDHVHRHHHQQQREEKPQIARAPSTVLQRLKSINMYGFKAEDFNPFYTMTASSHSEPQVQIQESQKPQFREQPQIARAPSNVLQRLKSINLYGFKPEDFNPFHTQTPEVVVQAQQPKQQKEKKKKKKKGSLVVDQDLQQQEEEELFLDGHHHQVHRSNSERKPIMIKASESRIQKSMSAKWDVRGDEQEDEDVVLVERVRPWTVREGNNKGKHKASELQRFGDEEVDSKADDFINKFKQQLKLQRLESIMGYKDLLLTKGGKEKL